MTVAVTFVYNDRCSAQAIIDFVTAQRFLSDDERCRLCCELMFDYLYWVGSGCCVRY